MMKNNVLHALFQILCVLFNFFVGIIWILFNHCVILLNNNVQ